MLESEAEKVEGDNKAAVIDGEVSIDWRSLEKTKIPAICQVNRQLQAETITLLDLLFRDWLPAMNVLKYGGAKHNSNFFKSWIELFGDKVVPHLRWFTMNTGASRILFILDGSDEELQAVEREEIKERSSLHEGMAVAITHVYGQPIDEDFPAWVECAVVDVLARLEQLVPTAGPQRLSAKAFKCLARYCVKVLRYYADECEGEEEADDESESENDSSNVRDDEQEE